MLSLAVSYKAFDQNRVLIRELEFFIDRGERVAMVGPSGAGKSTLLRMMAGLDNEYRGIIRWCDEAIGQALTKGTLTITKMFQEARLMPWLNARDNLLLVARDLEDRARVEPLLAQVGLMDCAELFPSQLSGGMKKRLALARALLPQPQLLLVDEPFASLDKPTAGLLRGLVLQVCEQQGITLIYVTHDLEEALTVGQRVMFFSKSPMQLVLDQKLGAKQTVQEHKQTLLERHPDLLVGRLGS